MTRPKSKYPIESFGAALMATLLTGSQRRVVIPFPGDKPKAVAFQRRIHTLRQRMREENHEKFPLAARAKVSLFWGSRAVEAGLLGNASEETLLAWRSDDRGRLGAFIVVQPQDAEFVDILAAAGVTLDSVKSTEAPTLPSSEAPKESDASVDDLMSDIYGDEANAKRK